MSIDISFDEASSLLDRAVSEKGESYVHRSSILEFDWLDCAYFNSDGTPSCLVGHVLAYKGLTLNDLGRYNVGVGIEELVRNGIIKIDDRTETLLDAAQCGQDTGVPWGMAVADARQRVKKHDHDEL